MRWDALFADLEAQWDAAEAAELAAEVADRTRREFGRVRLVDRLRPLLDAPLTLTVAGVGALTGQVLSVGPDWVLVSGPAARQILVPLAAITTAVGLTGLTAEPGSEGVVAARLDLRYALRGVARDRSAVHVTTTDGTTVAGTVDRVAADHIEIAEHDPEEPRRAGAVRRSVAIPLSALGAVRSAEPAG